MKSIAIFVQVFAIVDKGGYMEELILWRYGVSNVAPCSFTYTPIPSTFLWLF